MALGGFNYSTYTWAAHGDTQGEIESALSGLISWLTFPGWTCRSGTSPQMFLGSGADAAWFWVIENDSSLGSLVYCWTTLNSSADFIHATNIASGVTITSGAYDWGPLWVAYLEPGYTFGVGSPDQSGQIPSGTFKFSPIGGTTNLSLDSVISGGSHKFHTMVRGEEVILGISVDYNLAQPIDAWFMASPALYIPHHATDTHTAGSIHYYFGTALSDSNRQYQAKKADGGLAAYNTLTPTWYSAPLSLNVSDRSPWAYSEVFCYASSADLDNEGIIAGNGRKGRINPEMLRVVESNHTLYQRYASGNLVHIGSGVVVGYDSTNPAIT